MIPLGSKYFLKLWDDIVGQRCAAYLLCGARDKFMSLYGMEPVAAALLWDLLPDHVKEKPGCEPKHLLWALYVLKSYDTAINNGIRFCCNEKTSRSGIGLGICSSILKL
jgi:hypothetical protein